MQKFGTERAQMQLVIAQMISMVSQGKFQVWNRDKNNDFIEDNDLSKDEIQNYLLRALKMDCYMYSMFGDNEDIMHVFQSPFMRYDDEGEEDERVLYIKAYSEESERLEVVSLHYEGLHNDIGGN